MSTYSVTKDQIRRINLIDSNDGESFTIIDGGAEDTGLKGNSYIFLEHTFRRANVNGFDDSMMRLGLPIGTCVTATKDMHSDTIILLENEQIDHTSQANSVSSPNQMRDFGVDIDDCPKCYETGERAGRQSMTVSDFEIPFNYQKGLVLLKTKKPTTQELENCPIVILTLDAPWNPDETENPPNSLQSWDPDLSNEKEIIDTGARSLLADRIREGVNVHMMSGNWLPAQPSEFNIEYLEDDDGILEICEDLPSLKARLPDSDSDDDSSTDSLSSGSSDGTSAGMPALLARDYYDDSSFSTDSDDIAITDFSSDISDFDFDDDKTNNLPISTFHRISFLEEDEEKDEIRLSVSSELGSEGDEISLSVSLDISESYSVTSGKDMMRHILNNVTTKGDARADGSTPSEVLQY